MIDYRLYSHCAGVVLIEQMDVASVDGHLPGLMDCLCAEPGRSADKEVKGIASAATGFFKENTQTLPFGSAKALQCQDGGLLLDKDRRRWLDIDRRSACAGTYACGQSDQEK
jgi:hypothetical protein